MFPVTKKHANASFYTVRNTKITRQMLVFPRRHLRLCYLIVILAEADPMAIKNCGLYNKEFFIPASLNLSNPKLKSNSYFSMNILKENALVF